MNSFISSHALYKRILTILSLLIIAISKLIEPDLDLAKIGVAALLFIAMLVLDEFLAKKDYYSDGKIISNYKLGEMFAINIVQTLFIDNSFMLITCMILNFYICFEYLIQGIDYDSSSLFSKKLVIIIPLGINIARAFSVVNFEYKWQGYFIVHAILVLCMYYVVDWFVVQNDIYQSEKNKLILEKSEIEDTNNKLVEFQEKIKSINEQINYQRIDLGRANKELEQANIEIASQTEIMRFMTSTFNIDKCMDVICDAIMEVKKPKIVAMFVERDVFMNKFPGCVIKTNYTSMQSRLTKEIEKIYEAFKADNQKAFIFQNDELKKFKFIGDTNISSVAFIPIINEDGLYGMILVGSDKEDYFNNGLKYFETCIVEFNASIKSTKLYLRMQDMARKDGLTGIYNRIYFNELFTDVAKKAVENKRALSVALYDIDKFKNVNDTYGHLAGDEVIKMVAKTGQKYAELYNGFTCRYGGEEFLLVLPGYDEKEALKILEKMHEDIKQTVICYNDLEIAVNVCIGLTSYPSICDNTSLLVSRADKAMYHGKRNGRGRLVLDNPSIEE
ncbi:MAG: diguanylate cyclase [Wujia sp.]